MASDVDAVALFIHLLRYKLFMPCMCDQSAPDLDGRSVFIISCFAISLS